MRQENKNFGKWFQTPIFYRIGDAYYLDRESKYVVQNSYLFEVRKTKSDDTERFTLGMGVDGGDSGSVPGRLPVSHGISL